MALQIRRWQYTVADFARMVEAGIFAEDDRVELIDGIDVERETVIQSTPPDGTHYGAERLLERGQDIVLHTVNELQLSAEHILG
jgi:hypothetical protein